MTSWPAPEGRTTFQAFGADESTELSLPAALSPEPAAVDSDVVAAEAADASESELVLSAAELESPLPVEAASSDAVDAAAFYFPFHLAYLGLHERGRLQAGETVLVHAAAGGVGSAAVQLAVAAGARVIRRSRRGGAAAGGRARVGQA